MPTLFGTPVLAPSGDGRLELFVEGFDANLWHIWQTARSNGWSGWTSHGGSFGGDLFQPPAIAASGDGRLGVFVSAGTLQHIYQTAWSNGWSGWSSLGSPPPIGVEPILPADLAANADGRLELFLTNGQLWRLEQTAWSNGWSGWQSHGSPPGVFIIGPAKVAKNADGRLEVFALSDRGELWHIWQTAVAGPWSDWDNLGHGGVPLDDRPAVFPSADGRLELFVRGTDGALYHRWQTAASNGWSYWISHGSAGGGFLDHPVVGRSADGRLELFIVGLDGNMWHIWQTAASNG